MDNKYIAEEIGKICDEPGVHFKLHYVDYPDNVWTAPCFLTRERADKFLNDHSVEVICIIACHGRVYYYPHNETVKKTIIYGDEEDYKKSEAGI